MQEQCCANGNVKLLFARHKRIYLDQATAGWHRPRRIYDAQVVFSLQVLAAEILERVRCFSIDANSLVDCINVNILGLAQPITYVLLFFARCTCYIF
jgi:hypothetical protein